MNSRNIVKRAPHDPYKHLRTPQKARIIGSLELLEATGSTGSIPKADIYHLHGASVNQVKKIEKEWREATEERTKGEIERRTRRELERIRREGDLADAEYETDPDWPKEIEEDKEEQGEEETNDDG